MVVKRDPEPLDKVDVPQGTLEQHERRWERVSFAISSVLEGA